MLQYGTGTLRRCSCEMKWTGEAVGLVVDLSWTWGVRTPAPTFRGSCGGEKLFLVWDRRSRELFSEPGYEFAGWLAGSFQARTLFRPRSHTTLAANPTSWTETLPCLHRYATSPRN